MATNHAKQTGDLLTKREVAELLRVSTRTVENLTSRGIIPKITLGTKMVRYPLDGINRVLQASTTNAWLLVKSLRRRRSASAKFEDGRGPVYFRSFIWDTRWSVCDGRNTKKKLKKRSKGWPWNSPCTENTFNDRNKTELNLGHPSGWFETEQKHNK